MSKQQLLFKHLPNDFFEGWTTSEQEGFEYVGKGCPEIEMTYGTDTQEKGMMELKMEMEVLKGEVQALKKEREEMKKRKSIKKLIVTEDAFIEVWDNEYDDWWDEC